MRASKENAKLAAKFIERCQSLVAEEQVFLIDFLEAAIKKLPTEASYAKDKKRERKAAKSKLPHFAD